MWRSGSSRQPISENIRVGYERLLWGFWDREAGEKQRRNWRSFVRAYNRIKPFDLAVLQIAETGEIHALGVVKETFYLHIKNDLKYPPPLFNTL